MLLKITVLQFILLKPNKCYFQKQPRECVFPYPGAVLEIPG